MSWEEIKQAYRESGGAIKKNKILLAVGAIAAGTRILSELIGSGRYSATLYVLFLLAFLVSFVTGVWGPQTFDKLYRQTKQAGRHSVLRGVWKSTLLGLVVGLAVIIVVLPLVFFSMLGSSGMLLMLLYLIPLILTAFYVGPRISFATFFAMLDFKGPVEAIKASWALTQGKYWKIVGFFLATALPVLAASLVALSFSFMTILLFASSVEGDSLVASPFLSFMPVLAIFVAFIGYTLAITINIGAIVSFFRHLQKKK